MIDACRALLVKLVCKSRMRLLNQIGLLDISLSAKNHVELMLSLVIGAL